MKKLLSITFVILGILSINAQEKGKFRVGLDLGYVFAKDNGGVLFSLEPKFNLTDNSNIGIRIGVAASAASFDSHLDSDFDIDANINVLATYDYYFNNENSSTSPFLGGGVGWYAIGEINDSSDSPLNVGDQFGAMIRGGFELGKLRLALEYNILPKSKLEIGESIDNSYFGASIGFYVGGGKWKN